MEGFESPISDADKIHEVLRATGMSRSQVARELEVTYRTLYRWLDKGIKPRARQAADIDALFKSHVDLRPTVMKLARAMPDPLALIRKDAAVRDRFVLEMTYHSNAIEGSRMSIHDTERIIAGHTVRGRELFEMMEVVNHKNALQFVLDALRPGMKIDETFVLKLHSIVMYDFPSKSPGKYRSGYMTLTNTDKVLPNAQMVPVKMRAWLTQVNVYGKDPIGKVANDHYEFESIHLFADGNGRVGRLLMLTQLLSKGLPPPLIEMDDRHAYYLALGKGDLGDFKNMVQVVCEAMLKGYSVLMGKRSSE
jgi:Fic family protein